MGIDKSDIRHVIRNGVPENILSWAQELGRCGRDGKNATATILYCKSDLNHANAWVLNNLSNRSKCKDILSGFADSWNDAFDKSSMSYGNHQGKGINYWRAFIITHTVELKSMIIVNAHLAGLCRRKILLSMFHEEECCATSSGSCCDVCEAKAQCHTVIIKGKASIIGVHSSSLIQLS